MDHARGLSGRQALFARFSRRALQELVDLEKTSPGLSRPLILLTGGFSSLEMMTSAMDNGHADLIGVGRLSILCPQLPRLLEASRDDSDDTSSRQHVFLSTHLASVHKPWDAHSSRAMPWPSVEHILAQIIIFLWAAIPIQLRPQFPKLIGSGMEMGWYTVAMRDIPETDTLDFERPDVGTGLGAIIRMWLYVAPGPWKRQPWCCSLAVCVVGLALLIHSL
jgi:hypothetical protein